MPHPLHGLAWEERFDSSQAWTCRFRSTQSPEDSRALTLAGGFLLLFLASFGGQCSGGGAVPTIAVLLMAVPIFLGATHALRVDFEAPEVQSLRLDRGALAYSFSGCGAQFAATTEIEAFIEGELVVQVVDRDSTCLLRIHTSSPAFVARRLRAALARLREARSYRT